MEVIPVGSTTIQYDGVLDDQKFYNFLKDTLKGLGYSVTEGSYVQFSNNYAIEWSATKLVDDYMAYRLTLKIDFRGIKKGSSVKDGKQVEVKTGTVQLRIVWDMLLDYLDKWTHGISKLIRPVYDKMNAEVMDQRKATFEEEVQNLKTTIQTTLGQ